jgi:hypothetical protein
VLALETSMLVPSPWFAWSVIAYLAVTIIWPAIDAARHARYFWMVAIIVISPVAGPVWLTLRVTRRFAPVSGPG